MKKQIIIVALAVVLFAALARAQDKKPELTMEQQYVEARIGQINAEFQLFQMDLQAMARKYPAYTKELNQALNEVIKRLQPEIQELQKKLPKPQQPAAKPEPKK